MLRIGGRDAAGQAPWDRFCVGARHEMTVLGMIPDGDRILADNDRSQLGQEWDELVTAEAIDETAEFGQGGSGASKLIGVRDAGSSARSASTSV